MIDRKLAAHAVRIHQTERAARSPSQGGGCGDGRGEIARYPGRCAARSTNVHKRTAAIFKREKRENYRKIELLLMNLLQTPNFYCSHLLPPKSDEKLRSNLKKAKKQPKKTKASQPSKPVPRCWRKTPPLILLGLMM